MHRVSDQEALPARPTLVGRPDRDTTIELRGLSKRFADTVAVDDLTATVRPGWVTGFLGQNGAGKTTTL